MLPGFSSPFLSPPSSILVPLISLLSLATLATVTSANPFPNGLAPRQAESSEATQTFAPPTATFSVQPTATETGVAGGEEDQFWHLRYHHWLAMGSYATAEEFESKCSATFSNTSRTSLPEDGETPFSVVESWGPTTMGLSGYVVQVPVMDKIVLIFNEVAGWQGFNTTPSPPGFLAQQLNLGNSAQDATANGQALAMYLEARESTQNWAAAHQAVTTSNHQFSIVGHGYAGSIALIAALDLGWAGQVHYSHAMGAPRVFNPAAAQIYDNLFQGQSGQRAVANNDAVPQFIPESENYTFTTTGVHQVTDESSQYTMLLSNCHAAEDPVCAGGDNEEDHWFYFSSPGECGDPQPHLDEVQAVEGSLSQAGASIVASASSVSVASVASVSSVSAASVASVSAASASAAAPSVAPSDSNPAPSQPADSSTPRNVANIVGMLIVVGTVVIIV